MKTITITLSTQEINQLEQLKELYGEKAYTKVIKILIKEKFLQKQ